MAAVQRDDSVSGFLILQTGSTWDGVSPVGLRIKADDTNYYEPQIFQQDDPTTLRFTLDTDFSVDTLWEWPTDPGRFDPPPIVPQNGVVTSV